MPRTDKELASRKRYYALNIDAEREQARKRAQRRRQSISETPLEVIREHKERNSEVQAAYRRSNHMLLKTKAWKYRSDKKFQKKLREEAQEEVNVATLEESEGGRELDAPEA